MIAIDSTTRKKDRQQGPVIAFHTWRICQPGEKVNPVSSVNSARMPCSDVGGN